MKTKLIIILSLFLCTAVTAQVDTLKSKYNCTLVFVKNVKSLKGEIFAINDSSVTFKQKNNSDTLISVPATDIQKFRFIQKGNPGKGFLIGGGIGAFLGGAIGLASGDDEKQGDLGDAFRYSAGDKAAMGAIVGFIPGSLIGLAIGSSKFEIYIDGNINTFISKRERLVKYSVQQ